MPRLRALFSVATRYSVQPRLACAVAATALLWLVPGAVGRYSAIAALLIIAALTAYDFLVVPARGALILERSFPSTVGIGDEAYGAYTIVNASARAIHAELHDRFPALLRGGVQRTDIELDAGAEQVVSFAATGATRGSALLGAAALRVRTRMGLVAARYVYDLADDVRVVPSLTGVRRYRLLAMQHRLSAAGVRALRRKGSGQAFASLREYVQGDDPRFIDWKATSKKGKLISREFTVERSQTVITLVDAGRGMTQLSGEFTRFEHALSAALILTDIASNGGDRVGTLVFDDEVRAYVPPQASKGALQLVRNAFVPVLATTREPDYASAFRFLAARQPKRALIVFFTDVIDVRASQALLAHVSRSAARHLVLVVALRNDALYAAAQVALVPNGTGRGAGTEAATALFESAAAEELIQARNEALQRMRRAGVIVLDVSPGIMTASVVNQYLELKRRGAL